MIEISQAAVQRRISWIKAAHPTTTNPKELLKHPNVKILGKKRKLESNGNGNGNGNGKAKKSADSDSSSNSDSESESDNDNPKSSEILFPIEIVKEFSKGWEKPQAIGPGFHNLGNTCFLNSVLQCLTYTPPLARMCLTGMHSRQCRKQNFCIFCALESHIKQCLTTQSRVIAPKAFVQNIRSICRGFRLGRQEDAHELIRYLMQGLNNATLARPAESDKLPFKIMQTSFIYQVFGGCLRSQVKCHSCSYESNTFDPILDLSININGNAGKSIESALEQFVHPNLLNGDNKYKCDKCKKKVDASQRFTIHKKPMVLTIHLKRFGHSGKINRYIPFPTSLDIAPYLSDPKTKNTTYTLYGVIVHAGYSMHSGHYYCFVLNSNKQWYCMDDSSVQSVKLDSVLKQSAYMLFYFADQPKNTQNGTTKIEIPKQLDNKDKKPVRNGVKSPAKKENDNNSDDSDDSDDDEDKGTVLRHPLGQNPRVKMEKTSQPEKEQVKVQEKEQEYQNGKSEPETPPKKLKVLDLTKFAKTSLEEQIKVTKSEVKQEETAQTKNQKEDGEEDIGNSNLNHTDPSVSYLPHSSISPNGFPSSPSKTPTRTVRSVSMATNWMLKKKLGAYSVFKRYISRCPEQSKTKKRKHSEIDDSRTNEENTSSDNDSESEKIQNHSEKNGKSMNNGNSETLEPWTGPRQRDSDLLFSTSTVSKWEDISYQKELQQQMLLAHPALRPAVRERDTDDVEYDSGRRKKIRVAKPDMSGYPNIFQSIQNQKLRNNPNFEQMEINNNKHTNGKNGQSIPASTPFA